MKWEHKRNCIDDEGSLVCVCGLGEPRDLYHQGVPEFAAEDRPEES